MVMILDCVVLLLQSDLEVTTQDEDKQKGHLIALSSHASCIYNTYKYVRIYCVYIVEL